VYNIVNAMTGYALDSTVAKSSVLSSVKTETDKIASIKSTVEAITGYALDSTVAKSSVLASVKTETDKIQSIKTTVEAITGYALDSTVAKAATLTSVKTETDKIASIKTTVEAITGYALDSTVAKATVLADVKTQTDKLTSIKSTVEAITGYALDSTVAKATVLANVKTETDQIGTISNTGGTATIGAILGDWLNTNLKTKIEAIMSSLVNITEVTESTEDHFHNIERWYGKKAAPTAGVREMDNVLTVFRIDSGNNVYGTAICIIGTSDTPIINSSSLYFDIHRLLIVTTERSEPYKVRLTWGTTEAAGIAAGNYSTTMFSPNNTNGKTDPLDIMMPKLPVGTKIWANCWCANNTGTIDFYLGIHEYLQ